MNKVEKVLKPLGLLVSLAMLAVVVVMGVRFIIDGANFHEVIYDESLTETEIATLQDIFFGHSLKSDVKISAQNVLEIPELKDGQFVWEIFVPVTNFYSAEGNVEAKSADDLMENCPECELISVADLDNQRKLLRVNGEYYLETFRTGAVFRVLTFESENYAMEVAPLVEDAMRARKFPEADTVLTFAQTGVTALSRRMNSKLAQVGKGAYFAENIGPWLASFDLTHTSNEASFYDGATSADVCSKPQFFETLTSIGLDIVELTGNHNLDCGAQAAIDTIDLYRKHNILTVGGGKNAAEAAEPLQIKKKGSNITMLAFNESTGGATTGDTPGANQYYEETAAEQIKAAKDRGDLVIVDVQYYECNNYDVETEDATCDYADSSAGDQVGLFRHLVDLGADVVVGTSAHQPQTFELYKGSAIYYGLGNLFFDQSWWPGTTRSLVLVHYIYQGKLLQTQVVPTVYDDSFQTKVMDAATTKWYLERLVKGRP